MDSLEGEHSQNEDGWVRAPLIHELMTQDTVTLGNSRNGERCNEQRPLVLIFRTIHMI